MPQCCVPRCFNRSESNKEGLSFYRFPKNEFEKKRWVQLIRRANFTPTCNSRVCSWHFPYGKEAGPTRFAWNEDKSFLLLERYCMAGNRKKPMLRTEDNGSEEEQNSGASTKETSSSSKSLRVLQLENDMLKRENESLKRQLEKQKTTFSFGQISCSPDRIQYYTGLPDAATVVFVETLLSKCELKYHPDWTVRNMPLVDQLLMTLMKLKLNFGHLDLATRFSCSTTSVTNIVSTVTSALCNILYPGKKPPPGSQELVLAEKLLQDLAQLGTQRSEIMMVRL